MNYPAAGVRSLALATALCFSLTPQVGFALTETIVPDVYGEVTIDTSGWDLDSPVLSVDVIQDPNNNLEKRGFMEFPLASFSSDAIVTSATLELDVFSAGQGAIPIHGYAGDGVAQLSDSIILPSSEIGASDVITVDNSKMNVQLDVAFVQDLIGSGSHLGVLLLGSPNAMQTTFGQFGTPPAELVISALDPGDFNADGFISGLDFLAWQRGESPNPYSNSDLTVWETAYNNPIVASVAAIPEPATVSLYALGLLVPLSRRSKQK